MLTTTLALLHAAGACTARYRHLCAALGGAATYGKDTPISLTRILDTNGLDDALWALCAVPEHEIPLRDRLAPVFACDCAERVLPIFERERPGDARPRHAIAVARRFAAGQATNKERAAALAAAGAAARAAAGAAAEAAAGTAAWAAAEAAAGDAARAAARTAARAAAGDAARAAERQWQAVRFRELLEAASPAGDEGGR
jgi:Imm-5 like putative immunity protein